MSLKTDLEQIIVDAELTITTDRGSVVPLRVGDTTMQPPYARVSFGRASEVGIGFRLGLMAVTVVQPHSIDPMPLLADIFNAIQPSGAFDAADVIDVTNARPDEVPPFWAHIIDVTSLNVWYADG